MNPAGKSIIESVYCFMNRYDVITISSHGKIHCCASSRPNAILISETFAADQATNGSNF